MKLAFLITGADQPELVIRPKLRHQEESSSSAFLSSERLFGSETWLLTLRVPAGIFSLGEYLTIYGHERP